MSNTIFIEDSSFKNDKIKHQTKHLKKLYEIYSDIEIENIYILPINKEEEDANLFCFQSNLAQVDFNQISYSVTDISSNQDMMLLSVWPCIKTNISCAECKEVYVLGKELIIATIINVIHDSKDITQQWISSSFEEKINYLNFNKSLLQDCKQLIIDLINESQENYTINIDHLQPNIIKLLTIK